MYIRSTKVGSPMRQLASNPLADAVVGSDDDLPAEIKSDVRFDVGSGQLMFRLNPSQLAQRDDIGKQIKIADLGISGFRKALDASNVDLSQRADSSLSAASVVLSGMTLYQRLTKDEPDPISIAISATDTVSTLADLLTPIVPVLSSYKSHFKTVSILLELWGQYRDHRTKPEVIEIGFSTDEIESILNTS